MPNIFLSYRRADSSSETGRIYDWLVDSFGEKQVFKDVDDIPGGADFEEHIASAIRKCDVMLPVIGTSWLTIENSAGEQRLQNPDDYVRREIASGLRRDDMLVIPLLIRGAQMPSRSQLPDDLKALATRNAVRIRNDPDFRRDINYLIETIDEQFPHKIASSVPETTKPKVRPRPRWNNTGWLVGGVVIVALLIIAGLLYVSNWSDAPTVADTSQDTVSDTVADAITEIADATDMPEVAISTDANTAEPTQAPTDAPIAPSERVIELETEEFGRLFYLPESILLSVTPVVNGLTLPEFEGDTQFYGMLSFETDNPDFAVVLDQYNDESAELYIDLNQNNDLTDDNAVSFREALQSSVDVVEFSFVYSDERHPQFLEFYYGDNLDETADQPLQLSYYSVSARIGETILGDRTYQVGVLDYDANGLYDDDEDYIMIDYNGNRSFEEDEFLQLNAAIRIDNQCYAPQNLTASASTLTLAPIESGEFVGQLVNSQTQAPIAEASINVLPINATAETDADGMYRLDACPGQYGMIIATHPNYFTVEISQFDSPRLLVQPARQTVFDFDLEPVPPPPSGTVTLFDGDSYHFLDDEMYQYSDGDFYFTTGDNQFWANNFGQDGLVSFGDTDTPLEDISVAGIRASSLNKFGIEAIEGHVYVASAREDGNFIVFRVTDLSSSSVTLDFLYVRDD